MRKEYQQQQKERAAELPFGLFVALLASLNSRSENVIVKPIIIAELKLRNVKMQVFLADIMECADDTALEDAPEALNRLGMNGTDNILVLGVVNGPVRETETKVLVANPLIGADQADLVRHGFIDEGFQGRLLDVRNDASDHVTLAADCANDNGFSGSGRAGLPIALIPMPVLRLAADESFVNLNDAAKLRFRLDQGGTDFVGHQPSGFDRTETHVAAKLASAHSLFASQHQVSDFEPIAKRLVGVFENGPCDAGKAIAVGSAGFALPMVAGRKLVDLDVAAARAIHAIGPAARDQVGAASVLVTNRKHGVELGRSKLMDWFRAFHGVSSSVGGYNHA
jgi:hypothetical protein